jgi:hypothetical protein
VVEVLVFRVLDVGFFAEFEPAERWDRYEGGRDIG